MSDQTNITVAYEFAKAAPDGSEVAGWAYVTHDESGPVVDWSGDTTSTGVIAKAAHKYVTDARVAKAMHSGAKIGDVVESVMIDDDFAAAHGITHKKRGWWIKMKVDCPATRQRVLKGELRSFSLGGGGTRKELA